MSSWITTTAPSADSVQSSSNQSARWSRAARKAASVFSGASALAPRCAITSTGSRSSDVMLPRRRSPPSSTASPGSRRAAPQGRRRARQACRVGHRPAPREHCSTPGAPWPVPLHPRCRCTSAAAGTGGHDPADGSTTATGRLGRGDTGLDPGSSGPGRAACSASPRRAPAATHRRCSSRAATRPACTAGRAPTARLPGNAGDWTTWSQLREALRSFRSRTGSASRRTACGCRAASRSSPSGSSICSTGCCGCRGGCTWRPTARGWAGIPSCWPGWRRRGSGCFSSCRSRRAPRSNSSG
ncbi:MAG: hypothetical protein MZV63_06110 [Marinilabiliales bacterium]|nr:hypothetical protein [Marinilabiliales bacterium]